MADDYSLEELLAERQRRAAPQAQDADTRALLAEKERRSSVTAPRPDDADAIDVASSFGSGLAKGVTGLADIPAAAQRGLLWGTKKLGLPQPKHPIMIPTSRELMEKFNVNIPALKQEPKTTAGEYAQTFGEFVPFSGAGRGVTAAEPILDAATKVARNVGKSAAVPAVTSETAGQTFRGSEYEPLARLAGALTGTGLTHLPEYLTGTRAAENLVTRATEGATREQLDAAEHLFNEAQRIGVPITRAEAIQRVTNRGTGMADIQRVVEGQGGLKPFMSERPGQIERAVERETGNISPPVTNPENLGPRVGRAAEQEVIGAHAARTERASPFYRQAAEQQVPHEEVAAIVRRIDEMIAADPSGLTHGPLRELRESFVAEPARPRVSGVRTPIMDPRTGNIIRYNDIPSVPARPERYVTDIGTLNRIRKEFRDRTDLPAFSEKSIDKETGAKIGSLTDELSAASEARSLPLRLGQRAYQEATRDVVEPVEQGYTGRVAKPEITAEEASRQLFPRNPTEGSTENLVRTIEALEGREPMAARQLVRTHLTREFNEAAKNPNTSGAKFANSIAGNPQQRENLLAAIEALPTGERVRPGFETLLDVLFATGERQGIGSQTAFNQEIIKELSGGVPAQGLHIPRAALNWLQRVAIGRNTGELARLLTDPRASGDFMALATAPRGSRAFIRALSNLAARSASYTATRVAPPIVGEVTTEEPQKRARGGRTYPARKLSLEARRAHKEIADETRHLMDLPDEHIAAALRLAKG